MSAALVCAVGDLVEDVVVRLCDRPRRGADTWAAISRHRGGSAANAAVAAVAAGGRGRFVGQVGDDPLGQRLLDDLAAAGVEAPVVRRGSTGSIVVLVEPDGERTMLTDRGSATALDPADIDEAWLDGVSVLHVPAYSLGTDPLGASARRLVALARDRGIARSIDASSTTVLDALGTERFLDDLAALAPDVLFCNADEAAALDLDDGPPPGVALAIAKDGPRPARVLRPGMAPVAVPAVVTDLADTTGAGDSFAAGFLVAWCGGADPEQAVTAGHRAAVAGARP